MYKFRIFYKHNGSVSSTHSASFRLLVDIWYLLRCRCQEFFMLNKHHFRITSCQIFYHLRCYHGNSWPTLETIAWCDSREKFRNHLEKASVMWNLFYTSGRRTSSAKHLCTQVADEERKKNVFQCLVGDEREETSEQILKRWRNTSLGIIRASYGAK